MIIHIVQPNDTLSSIARSYGVSIQRIIIDNGLFNLPKLVLGQALIILIPEIVHTVNPGDTLFSIAETYGITYMNLLQKNPALIFNSSIYPGQQLTIAFQNQGNLPIRTYGYVYPHVNDSILKNILPYITSCAVFSYGFRADGTLIPINDQQIIDNCYAFKTAPILLLSSIDENSSFSSGLAGRLFNDLTLQNIVIENLINTMQSKGYLGIDIDFEYIPLTDRDAFVRFVQNITEQMHRYGFTVNVDLAPKTSSEQKGTLYEGHDYAALGQIADTVLIMTYEWGYTYGPPMAVAPLPQVRRVVEYAVSQIDNRKIYMGIPNYGYDWQLPYEKGVSRAISIGNEEAIRIAADNNAVIQYDQISESPFFEYTAPNGSNHVVWFEDIRSMQKKFQLIEEFNLLGGGYWNLMRPFAQNHAFLSWRYNIDKIVSW
ncbi:MAG: glycosyl hydrolase family 18 protein [Bacillota bacterium]